MTQEQLTYEQLLEQKGVLISAINKAMHIYDNESGDVSEDMNEVLYEAIAKIEGKHD